MTQKEIDTKFEIAGILNKYIDYNTYKALQPLYDYLQEKLRLHGVGRMLKGENKRCYTTWKKHSGITTMHKQKYKDSNGKILKATEVTKMYQDYLRLL